MRSFAALDACRKVTGRRIGGVFVILGTIKVKPDHLDGIPRTTCARHAGKEPAGTGMRPLRRAAGRDDPHTVCLYEVFRREADLEVHHAQDYYREWMAMSRDWRDPARYHRRVLTLINPEP